MDRGRTPCGQGEDRGRGRFICFFHPFLSWKKKKYEKRENMEKEKRIVHSERNNRSRATEKAAGMIFLSGGIVEPEGICLFIGRL